LSQTSDRPGEKQLELFRHIVEHVERRGFQPSPEELAAHFGVTAQAIRGRVDELEQRGLVKKPERWERNLELMHVEFEARWKKPEKSERTEKKMGKNDVAARS